jgi:hypothetical protein
MLEDPSHQDVARWGKDGDTFVVVEVRLPSPASNSFMDLWDSDKTSATGRKVHSIHPAETLQAQQHVEFHSTAE